MVIILALVTFTNSPRVTRWELLSEQQTRFRLPGVWLDEGTQTLYVRIGRGGEGKGGSGRSVPVATLRGSGFLTERVRPAAGTLIRVTVDRRGEVRAILLASDQPLRPDYSDDDGKPVVAHWDIGVPVRPF